MLSVAEIVVAEQEVSEYCENCQVISVPLNTKYCERCWEELLEDMYQHR